MKLLLHIFYLLLSIPITMVKSQGEHIDMLETKEKINKKFTDYSSDSSEIPKIKKNRPKTNEIELYDIHMTGTLRTYFALESALLDDQSNMLCSPVAALLPLGKLAYGSRGSTRDELLRASGISSKRKIGTTFRRLLYELRYLPGVHLNLATRMYVPERVTVTDRFKAKCENTFGTDVKRIDYHDRSRASQKINQWISEQTEGKITNVITPDQLMKDTSIVIANAIYFKGEWHRPFNKATIRDFVTPFGVKRIPMMSRNGMYEYVKSDNLQAQIIEIPYKGTGVTMIIVLPFSSSGLPKLLRKLRSSPSLLNTALHRTQSTKVLVSIPKFKMLQEIDLNTLYEKVGIEKIFERKKTEVSKIAKKGDLWVSEAVQIAFLEIHERGSSVSLGEHMDELYVEPKQVHFNASRPFLFYIQGMGEQLFAGLYYGIGIK